jgi:hypothetical protein
VGDDLEKLGYGKHILTKAIMKETPQRKSKYYSGILTASMENLTEPIPKTLVIKGYSVRIIHNGQNQPVKEKQTETLYETPKQVTPLIELPESGELIDESAKPSKPSENPVINITSDNNSEKQKEVSCKQNQDEPTIPINNEVNNQTLTPQELSNKNQKNEKSYENNKKTIENQKNKEKANTIETNTPLPNEIIIPTKLVKGDDYDIEMGTEGRDKTMKRKPEVLIEKIQVSKKCNRERDKMERAPIENIEKNKNI